RKKTSSPRKKRKVEEDSEEYSETDKKGQSARKVYDSDDLDEDSDDNPKPKRKGRASNGSSPRKAQPVKKKKQEDSDAELDLDLEDGQEVVGVVVQAPKTGLVPPGQISQNTIDFLTKLKDPAFNDREWFKLHGEYHQFDDTFDSTLARRTGISPC
ncbi:hypothetical protein GALMADRAFT_130931, partial [Galerina marginata CBS 339.88]